MESDRTVHFPVPIRCTVAKYCEIRMARGDRSKKAGTDRAEVNRRAQAQRGW